MYVAIANYQNPNAPEILTNSLRRTGFAVLENHMIPADLINTVYEEWRDFFASEAKFEYLYDKKEYDGYYPFQSENAKYTSVKDLKEFYHVYPQGKFPVNVSQRTMDLYWHMAELTKTILQWVEDALPKDIQSSLSIPLWQMTEKSPRTPLRILHYPPLSGIEEDGAVRAAAHEDINLITLLPSATAMGLQVQDTNGKWHEVECNPNNMVINVGDMLQECTNGYYQSTTHQVVNPAGDAAKYSRFSMPYFAHPHDDVVLSTKHTAKSYLTERLKELGVI